MNKLIKTLFLCAALIQGINVYAQSEEIPVAPVDSLEVLMQQINELNLEIDNLKARTSKIDAFVDSGIVPIMECDADTSSLFQANLKRYEDAVAGYEKVKFILEYYNPYGNANTERMARRVADRLANIQIVQDANSLLNKKHTKDETIQAMSSLKPFAAAGNISAADKELIEALSSNLNKDLNWSGKYFLPALAKLETWNLLPNEKTAQDAYKEVVYPMIVKKIEEVYAGQKELPAEMLRLNRVLSALTDATLNYSKSKYRGKISSEVGFKAWINELRNNL